MRRAARTDDNQHELVEALKKVGAKCYYIREPVDLLVGFRGRNILLEVKRGDKANWQSALTKAQKEFIEGWPGEVHVVYSIEEAVSAVVGKVVA